MASIPSISRTPTNVSTKHADTTILVYFLLLALGGIGPSITTVFANHSETAILGEVTRFQEAFKQELLRVLHQPDEAEQQQKPVRIFHVVAQQPGNREKSAVPDEYARFLFDYYIGGIVENVRKGVENFLLALAPKHGEEKAVAKVATTKAKAMREVQTALDKLEIDPELLDRLGQELLHAQWPPNEQVPNTQEQSHYPHHSNGDDSDTDNSDGCSRGVNHVHGSSNGTKTDSNGKTTNRKYDLKQLSTILQKQPAMTQKQPQPSSTSSLLSPPFSFFKTKLVTKSRLHETMELVYKLRTKSNSFVQRTRQELLLRQPLDAFDKLRLMMLNDRSEHLRQDRIQPQVNWIAKETNIYEQIPHYVLVAKFNVKAWCEQEKFIFPHEKEDNTEREHFAHAASPTYMRLAAELKNQLEVGNNLSLRKIHLSIDYPLEGLSKREQQLVEHLLPLALKINESVDHVYRQIEERLEKKFPVEGGVKEGIKKESLTSMELLLLLKEYDMVNTLSLLMHKKLEQLAVQQGQQQRQSQGNKLLMVALWLLAKRLARTSESLNKLNKQLKPAQSWVGEDLLKNATEQWEMPNAFDVDTIRRHEHNLYSRIAYCAAHLVFLYEQLNKVYDIHTLVGAKQGRNTTKMDNELSEMIESEAMLTPMIGAVFYNKWQQEELSKKKQAAVAAVEEKAHQEQHQLNKHGQQAAKVFVGIENEEEKPLEWTGNFDNEETFNFFLSPGNAAASGSHDSGSEGERGETSSSSMNWDTDEHEEGSAAVSAKGKNEQIMTVVETKKPIYDFKNNNVRVKVYKK